MAKTILDIHQVLAWVVVVSNGIVALWALGAHWRESLRHQGLWIATLVVQLTIFLQVFLGVYLMAVEGIEPPEFHTFYGFVMIITVGIVYSYRHQIKEYEYALYGGAGLFLMGLALRAVTLA